MRLRALRRGRTILGLRVEPFERKGATHRSSSPGPELSASLSIGKLFLEIDIGELLSISVAHDEASAVEFFKRPRRGETTRGGGMSAKGRPPESLMA
jgi:hypothetical protein